MGNDEEKETRADIIGACIIGVIMVVCILSAIALSPQYKDMGMQAFGEEGSSNMMYVIFYIVLVVVMAVVILLLIKFGLEKLIHIAFLGAVFSTVLFVLMPIFAMAINEDGSWENDEVNFEGETLWIEEENGILSVDKDGIPPDWYLMNRTLVLSDRYYIAENNYIELYQNNDKVSSFSMEFNKAIHADVMDDNGTEIVIGYSNGLIILDQDLQLLEMLDLDRNVTALHANKILGRDLASLIVGDDKGCVTVIDLSDGSMDEIDLGDEVGCLGKRVEAVYLKDEGDDSFTAYAITDSGLYHVEVEFSMMSLLIPGIIAGVIALGAVLLLVFFPEWYVIDITGVVLAIGATTLIGISLSTLPLVVLLIALAVYDFIAVYKTKHMITMASSVMDMRLPVLLVIPKSLDYSFRKQKALTKQLEEKEERGALFIGLGDIIIPGTLIVSSITFLSSSTTLGIGGNLLVALCTLLGMLVGFTILMKMVLSGKPQAGLPLLNSGAIAGYIIGYLLVFQDLGLGFTFDIGLF